MGWLALYEDYPSVQLKVEVGSTKCLETTGALPRCTRPSGLQESIDDQVACFQNSRVRLHVVAV